MVAARRPSLVSAASALLLFTIATAARAVVLTPVTSVSGLGTPYALALSPGGEHLYVANQGSGTVTIYDRNGVTGSLSGARNAGTNNPCNGNALKQVSGVAVSPDGKNVYVTSKFNHSILVFDRETSPGPNFGDLTCNSKVTSKTNLRKASSVSISPDGLDVYATATTSQNRITVYGRNAGTGVLTFKQTVADGTGGANSLRAPTASVVSPDNNFVYVTASNDNAITRFARGGSCPGGAGFLCSPTAIVDGASGADGLAGAGGVAISANGVNVYTAGTGEDEVGRFTTSPFAFVDVRANLAGPIVGLDGPTGVAVSPDGGYVFVASAVSGSVTAFSRGADTGLDKGPLTFVDSVIDATNLGGARAVVVSPDSKCVYVAAASVGHVEGYCLGTQDFGDAPNTYPTARAQNGPRHTTSGGTVFLGASVDSENDGVPDANAASDDNNGVDDEDGVTFDANQIANQASQVHVTLGGSAAAGGARLEAWVDFDHNGLFDGVGEQVFNNQALASGVNDLPFTPPSTTLNGNTVARFRVRGPATAALSPAGGAGDGEVEDHLVSISALANSHTVTIAGIGGNGSGTVVSSPAGLNCSTGLVGTCTGNFGELSPPTLTAQPATGSDFTSWGGDCSGSGTCTFVPFTSNKSVTATFTLQQFTLAVTVGPNGTVTSSPGSISCSNATCNDDFDYNTVVTLTAAPDPSYGLLAWTGDCAGAGVSLTCQVTMDQARTVGVTFAQNLFTLTVTTGLDTGNGTVTSSPAGIDCPNVNCAANFTSPTVVTLTATPGPFSVFNRWSEDGSPSSGDGVLTMTANHTADALFTLVPDVSVTVSDSPAVLPDTGGSISWTVVVTDDVNSEDPTGTVSLSTVAATGVTGISWTCTATLGASACPGGVTAGSGNLTNAAVDVPAGETVSLSFTGTAPARTTSGTVYNTATAAAEPGEVATANNTAAGAVKYKTVFNDGFESGTLPGAWSAKTP